MKKSIVISLLTVSTLFCTALCSFASTGKVTTDTLRLRKEASTDSETIALLSINDEVEILGEDYGWYKVKSGEKVGYVAAQYVNVLLDTDKTAENTNKDNKNTNELNNTLETNTDNKNNEMQENTENNQNEGKKTKPVLISGQKIYITPIINSLVINTVEKESDIEIISEISGWSYIKLGTTNGWVRTEDIETKEVEENTSNLETNSDNSSTQKVGYISGSSVNFRKTPNTSGEVITKLTRNTKVTVIEKDDGWAEIEYNGNRGYVSTDYISDTEIETTSRSSVTRTSTAVEKTESTQRTTPNAAQAAAQEPKVTSSFTGADVVAYAKKYLGCKYVYGGSTPSGFDCSGFTSYVYKHFGISLSRTSSGQASNGRAVSKSELAVGDIVCFSSSRSSKKIGHVGIYIGGGKFIHAANSRKGVITSNVTGGGYYFVTARRVI